ncbi:hypothetical protein [Nocardioides sp.]|uniref:hypothetical protein n=1 Tax=Nocardioides sp. TaxID=35761 RepID=UPI0035270B99
MTVATRSATVTPLADAPWGRVTVLAQLCLFLIPAVTAWTSTLTKTAVIPLAALAVTLLVGTGLLFSRAWRRAGGRIIMGTLAAAVLEVLLTFLLVLAYSSANPGWDLS